MIDTPKNLTRNILLGMLLGFVVGAGFLLSRNFPGRGQKFRFYVYF
jgi:LPS O-antigen subunit length determinant protein (WzzB/FepE family)